MTRWPIVHDLRYGLRRLIRQPGLAAVAVGTLALGIGANTAIFSAVDAVLLKPLPFAQPDRLVVVWERNLRRHRDRNVVNPANLVAWRERSTSFTGIAGFAPFEANVTGSDHPVRVPVGYVTGNFFQVLGARAARGRTLEAADSVPGAAPAVVLTDAAWRSRYGSTPDILGRRIRVNGEAATIVGVMPPAFAVPPRAELLIPIPEGERFKNAQGRWLVGVARLRPGVDLATARAEMDRIAATLEREVPDRDAGWGVSVYPLHADLVRQIRPALLVLMAAVGLLLLVACANVAHLLLARAVSREREIAIRLSLGASRRRLTAQLLTEAGILAVLGGFAGLLLARWMLDGLLAYVPEETRALTAIGLNGTTAAFTALVSLGSAFVFGLAPALQGVRSGLAHALREGGSQAGVGRGRRRLARLLVVGQVAAALMLLVGAGLFVRSFTRLTRVDPGFDASGVVAFDVSLSGERYADGAAQARFFGALTRELATLPGVEGAGAISWRPMGMGSATSFTVADRPAPAPGDEPVADVRMVTPGLFRTLGIRLRRGRFVTAADRADQPRVVVINEGMARELWPGANPIGKRIRMSWGAPLEAEVVGVVADVRLVSLETPPRATLYWPVDQLPNSFMTLMVRSPLPLERLAPALRSEVARLDPELPLAHVARLEDVIADSVAQPRFTLALTTAFAVAALLLAGLGLFGVLSHVVSLRRTEMGVRRAMGAGGADIVRLLVGEGLGLVAAGLGAGLAASFALTSALHPLLFETSPFDAATYGTVSGLLLLVAILAAGLPARRAARLDPARILRED